MQLPDHHIDAFIDLYQKHYGIKLDRDVALEKGLELCRFVELVLQNKNENAHAKN